MPSPEIDYLLSRARSLFGAGMGVQSLALLSLIIRGTSGLRWEEVRSMTTTSLHFC